MLYEGLWHVIIVKKQKLKPTLFSTITLATSPTGLWESTDDKTGKPRSLICISEYNGGYSSVAEKGLLEGDTSERLCDKCTDERKDQKIIGMTNIKSIKEKMATIRWYYFSTPIMAKFTNARCS